MTSEEIDIEEDSKRVTVGSATGTDEILNLGVDKWIESVEFESTEDVPIPETLVDQVIGQKQVR